MELLILLLSFAICFLGLIMMMGLSIANVEILLDAKFDSEKKAQFSDFGSDGKEISRWQYTYYEPDNVYIPFLPGDTPGGIQTDLESFKIELNNPYYSTSGTQYQFNDFNVIHPKNAENIGTDTPILSVHAANLHKGTSSDHEENIYTISDHRYFDRQKTYEAIERIVGTSLKNIDLENNYSNTVFYPAMQVFERQEEL